MEYGFPRELYEIQRNFIDDATKVIENGKFGIFSSPTGTGKTLSLLCVATKFLDHVEDDDMFYLLNTQSRTKIYYCSRTHSQLSQVIKELGTNKKRISSVVLGSRKIYCVNKDVKKLGNAELINDGCKTCIKNGTCSFYNNIYYDNRLLDVEDLVSLGTEKNFCPYYYAKNKASDCEIVFLPYTTLFSRESRESMGITLKDKILIIDEAHNIYNTIIDINSCEVSWDDIRNISKIIGLTLELEQIIIQLLNFYKNLKVSIMKEGKDIVQQIFKIVDFLILNKLTTYNMLDIADYIDKKRLAQKNEMKCIFEFAKFLKLLTFSDEGGRVLCDSNKIKFTCIDPKLYFEDFRECKSVIFAGGTMEPINGLKSIFPNIDYYTYSSMNTKFTVDIVSETYNNKLINLSFNERDNQINDVLNSLVALANPIHFGGIVIFLPSKAFLNIIKNNEICKNFKRNVCFEGSMTLDDFKKNPQILFAVMGGSLSEGINFSDDMCRLLIVVGVPYPIKDVEFEERCKYIPDYGATCAMKSVNQTIGRAIRHKDDYASIILLDSRYVFLKNKLSPWILKDARVSKFVDALIRINKFYKAQSDSTS